MTAAEHIAKAGHYMNTPHLRTREDSAEIATAHALIAIAKLLAANPAKRIKP